MEAGYTIKAHLNGWGEIKSTQIQGKCNEAFHWHTYLVTTQHCQTTQTIWQKESLKKILRNRNLQINALITQRQLHEFNAFRTTSYILLNFVFVVTQFCIFWLQRKLEKWSFLLLCIELNSLTNGWWFLSQHKTTECQHQHFPEHVYSYKFYCNTPRLYSQW